MSQPNRTLMSRPTNPSYLDRAARPPSREAASECSPRRKPWVGQPCHPAPEGAKDTSSIPQILFVEGNLVLTQKLQILLLKRPLVMVNFRFRDVPHHRRRAGFTNAKNPIPGLPRKSSIMRPFFVDPARGICLKHTCHLRDSMNGRNPDQRMNVICGPIYHKGDSTHLANNSAELGKQIGPEIRPYRWAKLLRAEITWTNTWADVCGIFLRPIRAGVAIQIFPTACAVGFILAGLRGL
jgi:hypothetical protein